MNDWSKKIVCVVLLGLPLSKPVFPEEREEAHCPEDVVVDASRVYDLVLIAASGCPFNSA